MKQQEVINLLIEKTKSGEMVWWSYTNRVNYKTEYRVNNGNNEYIFIEHFLTQELVYNRESIIKGIKILRTLYWVILEQQKNIDDDKLTGIYHDILTGQG